MIHNNIHHGRLSDVNPDELYTSALNSEEPWATVLDVLSVTNYLSSYVSATGTDAATNEARDLYAVDQSIQNQPLSWSDAVRLFNEYENNYAANGKVLAFKSDSLGAIAIVNGIIDFTGLEHDLVLTFFQVLYNECEKRGVPEYIDPSIVVE